MQMRLAAKAPNEGARLLVRAISRDSEHVCARLRLAGFTETMVERLVLGEVIPGADMAWALFTATAISSKTWRAPAAGWWFAGMSPRSRSKTMRAGVHPLLARARAGGPGGDKPPLYASASPDSLSSEACG